MSHPKGYSNTKYTEQSILNDSYDETSNVLSVQQLEFDPSGVARRKVTSELISLIDASGSITYIGEATPTSTASDAVWQITRVDDSTNPVTVLYAGGNSNFDKVWNNRASLSYS